MLKKFRKIQLNRTLFTVVLIFWLVESVLVLHRHHAFYPSYTSFDQGIFNQVFWNSIHGNFFQGSLSSTESISFPVPDVSYHRLGQHFTPALLLWLPIYALLPSASTLLVLNVSLITAAGIVLYFLGCQRLDPKLATWIVISFYGTKAIIGPTLGNFQDLCQLPLFMFGLFLALEKRAWIWFCVLGLLVLAVREDAGILLFSVGFYLIASKRHPLIGLGVCGISFAYCLAITSLVMPLFSADVPQRFLMDQFGQYVEGDSASGLAILWGMIRNPGKLLIEIFTPFSRTIQYLINHSLSLGLIPFVSPSTWALTAFPLLTLFLRDDYWALSMNMRFALTVVPGLFYGAILWWSHHPKVFKLKFKRFWATCIAISIFFALTSNPHRALSFVIPDSLDPKVYLSPLSQWQHAQQIYDFLGRIPPNASVSATKHLVPHLSDRREMLDFPKLELMNDAKEKIMVEYAIADLRQLQQYQAGFGDDRDRLRRMVPEIERLISEGNYGLIACRDGIVLMQKAKPSDPEALSAWTAFQAEIEPILQQNS